MLKVLKYQRESKDDSLKGSSDKNPSRGVSSCLFIRSRLFFRMAKNIPCLMEVKEQEEMHLRTFLKDRSLW